jgi:ABC-type molybdate transport system ATPase subunit
VIEVLELADLLDRYPRNLSGGVTQSGTAEVLPRDHCSG